MLTKIQILKDYAQISYTLDFWTKLLARDKDDIR
jgi:hypothetical protein